LASIVDKINIDKAWHIITLEDPIEYIHQHKKSVINQREIGINSQSFAQALRASLREDPDVILVGEMRDLETMSNALTAAETGHLVFATLHTRSAAQSVNRVIDAFPAGQQEQVRIQFAETIQMVISQFLVPSKSSTSQCLACEIMVANPGIRNLIREHKTYQISTIIESNGCLGMQTLDQSLKSLITHRKIDLRIAKRYAVDKSYFSH
ncbi:MAG: type IV pili twitching motility protein PilT, partial [Candidatus Omnitrophota bacterium]